MTTFVGWVVAGAWFLARSVLIGWASLAIYYSNLPWVAARRLVAVAFAGFAIWATWWSGQPTMQAVLALLLLVVVAWWLTIAPSHDRHWRAEVAVMPRATVEGDRVHLTGVRNFEYRSAHDFTACYEEREVRLSRVAGLDFFVSYWREGLVAHTFLSFVFDDAKPLCVSIETRPEEGEGFAPIASPFKQFELIYVVGDERDVVGVRAAHRGERIYLYHLNTSPEDARRLLRIYLARINQLAVEPEFYHLLSNSCTINIVRYANAAGRKGRFDLRHVFNGLIDSYLYHSGRVSSALPFQELRRRSRIDDVARAAMRAPDFSERIRASLPSPGRADPVGPRPLAGGRG